MHLNNPKMQSLLQKINSVSKIQGYKENNSSNLLEISPGSIYTKTNSSKILSDASNQTSKNSNDLGQNKNHLYYSTISNHNNISHQSTPFDYICIENLSKKYQEYVFRNINVKIELSKLTCIVGESGSGKSTLLHLIGGIDTPSQGQVRFPFNLNLFDPITRARHIGFVFQNHYLISDLNVLENVAVASSILHTKDLAYEFAYEALTKAGIKHVANKMPNQLSGGEQQRVAIARAIVNKPQFLLADEPTGNLDLNNAMKILELFLSLKSSGITIIIVTHSEMIYKQADMIYKMINGNLQSITLNKIMHNL